MSKSVCLYLQLHQPWRLTPVSVLHNEIPSDLFLGPDRGTNESILKKVADTSYRPTFATLERMLEANDQFCFSISLTGTLVEQLLTWAPDVITTVQRLVQTGRVEILAETYSHSVCFLWSKHEWAAQIAQHTEMVQTLFGVIPTVLRNTELIYRDDLGVMAAAMGYRGMLAEGWASNLQGEDPTYVRNAAPFELTADDQAIAEKHRMARNVLPDRFGILTKQYTLSDDIAFRFSNKSWPAWPLTADTFANWVAETPGDTVNLFMDFETFGEHQWADTGIFQFLEHVPPELHKKGIDWKTPSETLAAYGAVGTYAAPNYVSWADEARDITAWVENDMQRSAMEMLRELEGELHQQKDSADARWQDVWAAYRRLTTSDHLYYMCTKYFADGDVHAYFSPYENPYQAFMAFTAVYAKVRAMKPA